MTNAVIDGLYADFKFVKTRGVAQVVIEIPLERAAGFVEMFGVPNPAEEAWVAVAKLVKPAPERVDDDEQALQGGGRGSSEDPRPASAPRRFEEMPRAQQAGILCNEDHFRQYIGVETEDEAAAWVRATCRVASRTELNAKAPDQWDKIVSDYRTWERYGDMRP